MLIRTTFMNSFGLTLLRSSALLPLIAASLMAQTAAPPVFSPGGGSYPGPQTVTITSATAGASIFLTLEGETPGCGTGFIYVGPLIVTFPTTMKAIACAPGLADSARVSETYTILAAAPPVFSPGGGNHAGPQMVTITSPSVDAYIRYTTDGTTPSPTVGTPYSGPVAVNASATLKAIVYGPGLVSSEVVAAAYNILVAEPPAFSLPSGTYSNAQVVTMASSTPGATIRYTTEGTIPSATLGTVYTGPVTVGATTTLKAVAIAPSYGVSPVAQADYTITPPEITSVSPTSGVAGAQVAVTGTGFGAEQGAGSVWLGTRQGTVLSWSNTQIVATVAAGATPGTVQVNRAGSKSNAVAFNVIKAAISDVTPTSAASGSPVTITGSGFGAVQGSGHVWLGSASGVVQSWSDTQIVALVAAEAASGSARVLQNGVVSNAVEFQVNSLKITSVTPDSGVPGTSVTIAGIGFGALQGSGSVWLGSVAGQVLSWSDTEVVAVVASGSVTGIARVEQNAKRSNAPHFTVPASGGNTVAPSILTMVVGETHEIQALSETGQPVTGLAWTTTDANVVSLSNADPPVLTAVTAGRATIKAGSASADVTVSVDALPVGTVLWSNPGNGSGVDQIVPAVPSPSGVADVFAFQDDGTVQAITSDGKTAWTAEASRWSALPDFQGGLVLQEYDSWNGSIVKLNGITGQRYPAYTPGGDSWLESGMAVHPDGTVFAFQRNGESSAVIGIDPTTGTQKFSVTLPAGFAENAYGFIVAGDGYAYMPWHYRTESYWEDGYVTFHLMLLRVNSEGAYNVMTLRDWRVYSAVDGALFWTNMITNADTGVVLTWSDFGDGTSDVVDRHMAVVTGTSVTLMNSPTVPGQNGDPVVPALQREDGSFVGTASVGDESVPYMVAFDQTGAVLWSVPNEEPKIATADGGVIGKSGIAYDQNGSATGQMGSLPTYSWTANGYQIGSVEQLVTNWLNLAVTFWPFSGGNASGNGTATRPATKEVQSLIAQKASYYAETHSSHWPDVQGNNKCNLFVKDVLNEAGAQAPLSLGTRVRHYLGEVNTPSYPASAGDWAYPHNTMTCWRNVTAPNDRLNSEYPADVARPGDVIAEAIGYSDASGHVGIVVGPNQTASADSAAPCFSPYPIAGTIDVTDFGFRPANWIDPFKDPTGQPCRTSGLKSNAVVKRFVCQ
jgi:hypothetical protein